jgi:hypothetical protein
MGRACAADREAEVVELEERQNYDNEYPGHMQFSLYLCAGAVTGRIAAWP